jgi:hypothetical protein
LRALRFIDFALSKMDVRRPADYSMDITAEDAKPQIHAGLHGFAE